MARKSTPSKSSPKDKEDQNNNTNQQSQSKQKQLDLSKSKKKGKLKPKSLNTSLNPQSSTDGTLMMYNTIYPNFPTAPMLYYPQVIPNYGIYDAWSAVSCQNVIYSLPVLPMVVNPLQTIAPICPLTLPPLVSSSQITQEVMPIYGNGEQRTYPANVSPNILPSSSYVEEYQNTDYRYTQGVQLNSETQPEFGQSMDELSYYLSLPKEFFPPARLFNLDPNPIIDEFCTQTDLLDHVSWILDLEFGIPKVPITRPIPVYDVQYNSVHCKNTPGAIHPGFEKCSQNFQKAFLFYYDCIVSTWYNGYMNLNQDRSVQNFQSWLVIPMQVLGMCWA